MDADPAEDLARPAHFTGRDVFEHQDEQTIVVGDGLARKGDLGPFQLARQRAPVGGQVVKPPPVSLAISYSGCRSSRVAGRMMNVMRVRP